MSKRQATLSFGTVAAPKRAKLDPTPFSLETFRANLSTSPPQGSSVKVSVRELLRLELETLDESWLKAGLSKELEKGYFLKLKAFLWEEGMRGVGGKKIEGKKLMFPPGELEGNDDKRKTVADSRMQSLAADIYAWSRFTTLPNVKVVILGPSIPSTTKKRSKTDSGCKYEIGQDPYHDDNQAMGLSFSVRRTITKIPPSLRNIYKEISSNYPLFLTPSHGDLSSWAAQGVLLLNSSLTVRAHEANSHGKAGWEGFTDKVIDLINAREGNGVVFLAWGASATKRMARIDKSRHLVLESAVSLSLCSLFVLSFRFYTIFCLRNGMTDKCGIASESTECA